MADTATYRRCGRRNKPKSRSSAPRACARASPRSRYSRVPTCPSNQARSSPLSAPRVRASRPSCAASACSETPDAGHIWFHGQDLTAERCNITTSCARTSVWCSRALTCSTTWMCSTTARSRPSRSKDEQGRGREGRDGTSDQRGLEKFAHAAVGRLSGGSKTARGHRSCLLCMNPQIMLYR